MTNDEFYQEFQILYNNIMNNQAPGLDYYEVSVFLTRAQEEFIRGYYNGSVGESFEGDEEVRRYLSSLVKTIKPALQPDVSEIPNTAIYNLPEDVWYITMERITTKWGECTDVNAEVVPVTQDDFQRIIKNPFKGPTNRRVLRLDINDNVEIVHKPNVTIEDYTIRYVSKPSPIILTDLNNGEYLGSGLSIDGVTQETSCNLHPALHRKILEGAVQLAIASLKTPSNNR